jgi:hypothetical protein
MNSSDLTFQQSKALEEKYRKLQHELSSLVERMYEREFPHGDILQTLTIQALDAVERCRLYTHQLSVPAKHQQISAELSKLIEAPG